MPGSALRPGAYPQLRAVPGYAVSAIPANGFACLALNLKDPVLRDANVRRALALDRERIIRTATHGVYSVTNSDQTPLSWAYDSKALRIPYNPAAARRLLDRAGRGVTPNGIRTRAGKRLELQLATCPDTRRPR